MSLYSGCLCRFVFEPAVYDRRSMVAMSIYWLKVQQGLELVFGRVFLRLIPYSRLLT